MDSKSPAPRPGEAVAFSMRRLVPVNPGSVLRARRVHEVRFLLESGLPFAVCVGR